MVKVHSEAGTQGSPKAWEVGKMFHPIPKGLYEFLISKSEDDSPQKAVIITQGAFSLPPSLGCP